MLPAPSPAPRWNDSPGIRYHLPLEHQLSGGVVPLRLAAELLHRLQACLLLNCLVDLVSLHLTPDDSPQLGGLDTKCFEPLFWDFELLKSDVWVVLDEGLRKEQWLPVLFTACWWSGWDSTSIQQVGGDQVALDPWLLHSIQAQDLAPLVWDPSPPSALTRQALDAVSDH